MEAVATRLNVETGVDKAADGSPVLAVADEESIASTCSNVEWVFGESSTAGQGTLYLTTRRIVWIGATHSFSLRYQQVVMHAISRDPSVAAKPCVYLQLDEGSEDMNMQDDEEEQEEQVAAEIRLVPADESKVDELFKVLCDCAALNPDDDGEESGEGEFFFNDAEVMAGLDPDTRSAVMAARLAGGMAMEDEGDEGEEEYDDEEEDEEGGAGRGGAGGGGELQALVGDDPGRFEDDDMDASNQPNANGH